MILNVVEVFDSMQGEGEWMGTYCTFIRLPGCNYRCPFCDTDFSKAEFVLDTDTQAMQKHVVITGGEPTIHPRISELIMNLKNKGHFIHVETNGTHIHVIPDMTKTWITCSPKREEWMKKPEHVTDWWNNIGLIDELKLVVDEDFKPEDWVDKLPCLIWLQPCDGPYLEKSKARIIEIIKKYPDTFRAGIQLHKYYEVV